MYRALSSGRLLPLAFACILSASAPAAETVLAQMGTAIRYNLPTSNTLGVTWITSGFNDATWTAGSYGIGYDAGGMIKSTVANTVDAAYTRAKFTIADLTAVESVWLGVDYDDGYIAWINGVEVARVNMPAGNPTNTTLASASHESSNGDSPTYDPIVEITTKAKPALVEGLNVLAIGVWNNSAASTDMALVPFLSINRPVTPPGVVHWTLADSPVAINSSLTIPLNTTLKIDAGVEARFAAGASLTVRGQIEADGTVEAPIVFDRQGATGAWGGIKIHQDEDGIVRNSYIRQARIQNAGTLVDVDGTGESDIVIEDCTLDHWSGVAFHWDNGCNKLRISRCDVGLNTPVSEQGHEGVNGYRSSAILEHCVFGPRTGYNDTIDLGNTKWGGPVPTVRYNEIGPGNDDGIDFDDCDGFIIGNFVHGRRPPANGPKESGCPQYPIGGSGMNGGGITGNEGSRPFVMNNIVFDCYHGIGYKNGAQPTLINNTVVSCTWGIILFSENDISNPALANGTLVNNLIWDCEIPIKLSWCDNATKSTASVRNCLVPGGWPGTGNINPVESPLALVPNKASPKREDFLLVRCSAAIDAGFAGQVTQTFHAEPVPDIDSEAMPRVDMLTVADSGAGSPKHYDVGAIEYQGPDDCGGQPVAHFVRGEANGDGSIDISDAVNMLFVFFAGAPTDCEDALDANDDGSLNVTDAVRLLDYLFRAGAAPAAPFPAASSDPTTADALGCERTS